jgi:hypothetical protein
MGEVGEGCGKFCEYYKPRNGKNVRRCRHSANCEADENPITIKL